jgi:hypothetical protein
MLKGSWAIKVPSASASILASQVVPERWDPVTSIGFPSCLTGRRKSAPSLERTVAVYVRGRGARLSARKLHVKRW